MRPADGGYFFVGKEGTDLARELLKATEAPVRPAVLVENFFPGIIHEPGPGVEFVGIGSAKPDWWGVPWHMTPVSPVLFIPGQKEPTVGKAVFRHALPLRIVVPRAELEAACVDSAVTEDVAKRIGERIGRDLDRMMLGAFVLQRREFLDAYRVAYR